MIAPSPTMPAMVATMTDLPPLSDGEALARVLGGDSAAFEVLMRRHNQRLYRVARSVVRDDLEAEDVVQEAFVRAYSHLARFEGRSSVATWLTKIAFHEALRRRRRRLREAAFVRSIGDGHPRYGSVPKDAAMAEATETRSTMTRALDALPTVQRAVVVLRLAEGLSTRETAECLRLSEANVKVLLRRGRQTLQEQLLDHRLGDLRGEYAFGHERCDRVVEAVFRRIGGLSITRR